MRIGIAWYKREEYDRIKAVMEDSHLLPKTYDKFLASFEQGFKVLVGEGHVAIKVYINPDTFPLWCRQRGLKVDRSGRLAFGHEAAKTFGEDN